MHLIILDSFMSKYTKYKDVEGFVKKFDKNLLDKFDEPARNKLKQVLGEILIDNPNVYGADFLINKETCISKYKYLEVQVCSQWVGDIYPYKNLYIYARKFTYDNDTLFITLDRELTEGYLFDLATIRENKPRRFKKYSREFVYDIPWHRAVHVYMDNVDKMTFEMLH